MQKAERKQNIICDSEKICVEGVEKSEWSRRLRNLNVDYLQGYLYGKPCEKSTDVVARWGVIK